MMSHPLFAGVIRWPARGRWRVWFNREYGIWIYSGPGRQHGSTRMGRADNLPAIFKTIEAYERYDKQEWDAFQEGLKHL